MRRELFLNARYQKQLEQLKKINSENSTLEKLEAIKLDCNFLPKSAGGAWVLTQEEFDQFFWGYKHRYELIEVISEINKQLEKTKQVLREILTPVLGLDSFQFNTKFIWASNAIDKTIFHINNFLEISMGWNQSQLHSLYSQLIIRISEVFLVIESMGEDLKDYLQENGKEEISSNQKKSQVTQILENTCDQFSDIFDDILKKMGIPAAQQYLINKEEKKESLVKIVKENDRDAVGLFRFLPREILLQIMGKLEKKYLYKARGLSKYFKTMTHDQLPSLDKLKIVYMEKYPDAAVKTPASPKNFSHSFLKRFDPMNQIKKNCLAGKTDKLDSILKDYAPPNILENDRINIFINPDDVADLFLLALKNKKDASGMVATLYQFFNEYSLFDLSAIYFSPSRRWLLRGLIKYRLSLDDLKNLSMDLATREFIFLCQSELLDPPLEYLSRLAGDGMRADTDEKRNKILSSVKFMMQCAFANNKTCLRALKKKEIHSSPFADSLFIFLIKYGSESADFDEYIRYFDMENDCDKHGNSILEVMLRHGFSSHIPKILKYFSNLTDLLNGLETKKEDTAYKGWTHLHTLIKYAHDNVAMAELFLQHGANPNKGDKEGNTPLHRLALERYYQFNFSALAPIAIIDVLLKYHADIECKNAAGETPLFVAAKAGKIALVQYFLQKNADPTVINNEGKTLLQFVEEKNDLQLFRIIKQAIKTKQGIPTKAQIIEENSRLKKENQELQQVLEESYHASFSSKRG